MKYLKIGLAAAGITWFSLIAGALFWNLAPGDNIFGLPTRASADAGQYSPGSVGQSRSLMLIEATRLYKESDAEILPSIADGTELAPMSFLNRELERQGAKWRVRSVNGLSAEISEISWHRNIGPTIPAPA